ncbi:phytanoyl-CoA dioxygenase family protein [Streptomyces sp. NPDC088270]|uniref:phytanoyl-CoA dioxygenase family protein n=1 Tax=Streptomyces sp. NPDC088270 TaxID=3160990 RepID=UPI00341D571B
MVDHPIVLPRTAEPDEVAAAVARYGYAIVEDLAPQSLLDDLAAEAAPFIEASDSGRDVYDGLQTRRTGALIARCPTSRSLVMNPLAVATARKFLSHATAVQLHLTQIISLGPGETLQKTHRDQMAFDFYPFPPDYHVQLNTMWALTDFTLENGATHIAPGSSGMSDEEAATVPMIRAVMRRGSVMFYDGKVVHCAGANHTDKVRTGVNITYAVGWVRQEENQFLACPPEIARALDDDLLRMMGYQSGAFALGYVGDQQDPLATLHGIEEKVPVVGAFVESNESFKTFVTEMPGE